MQTRRDAQNRNRRIGCLNMVRAEVGKPPCPQVCSTCAVLVLGNPCARCTIE
jgi:hypothetical protein